MEKLNQQLVEPSLAFTVLVQITEDVQEFVYAQLYFNQVEVWTLTGPLQHLYSLPFEPFCYRFAAGLGSSSSFSRALVVRQMSSYLIFSDCKVSEFVS